MLFVNPARNVNQLPRISHANYFLITVSRLSPFLNPVNSTTTNTGTICCAPDFGFCLPLLSLIRSNHSPAQRPSFPALQIHRGSLNSSLYQSNQVVAWQDGWGSWCYCYPARSNICPALSWH